jgi:arginyl-tRNA--protein-N-Asp/Glu arginylyltransferase
VINGSAKLLTYWIHKIVRMKFKAEYWNPDIINSSVHPK